MYVPVLGACLVAGWQSRSFADVTVHAALMGLITQVVKLVLGFVGAPGHLKSAALEDPLYFWTVSALRVTFGYLVILGLAHLTGRRRP